MIDITESAKRIDGQPMFKYLDRANELERQGKDLVHMEIGDPDFVTPKNIINSAFYSLSNGGTHYCSSYGLEKFRLVIRDHIKKTRGFEPDINQILVTPGANIAIFYSVFCLAEPGSNILIPDPGFSTYYSVAKMCGVHVKRIPLLEKNNFVIDLDYVEKIIDSRTRFLIVNSPNNPTGSVMTQYQMDKLYDIASRKNIVIYSDEIYSRMNYTNEIYATPAKNDKCCKRVILSDGFSKSFAMTGWRLGYVVAPKTLIERMSALLQTTSSCVSPFIQDAGIEALTGSQIDLDIMMSEYQQRRNYLVDALNEISNIHVLTPGGAFYLFVNITKTNIPCEKVVEQLMDYGVVSLPGTCFGNHGQGYIRLCYAQSKENITKAVNRIKKWSNDIESL